MDPPSIPLSPTLLNPDDVFNLKYVGTFYHYQNADTCIGEVLVVWDLYTGPIIAVYHLLFIKIFSNFVHFCPNFQIFCPFLTFFALFLLFF